MYKTAIMSAVYIHSENHRAGILPPAAATPYLHCVLYEFCQMRPLRPLSYPLCSALRPM